MQTVNMPLPSQSSGNNNTGTVVVETVDLDTTDTSEVDGQTDQQNSPTPYTTLFSDAFNYIGPANVLSSNNGSGASNRTNDSIEIDFIEQDQSNLNTTSDIPRGLKGAQGFQLLFKIFGEPLTDVDIEWFQAMRFVDAADIVFFSASPAEQIYKSMIYSPEILHGYRRYGPTHIDRRFVEIYTTLRLIYLWFFIELKCSPSSRETIVSHLIRLMNQRPLEDKVNMYFQLVNMDLVLQFSALPKLASYITWRNQQGSYTNGMYEAWSSRYDQSIANTQANKAPTDGTSSVYQPVTQKPPTNKSSIVQPTVTDKGPSITGPSVQPKATTSSTTPYVPVDPRNFVQPADPKAYVQIPQVSQPNIYHPPPTAPTAPAVPIPTALEDDPHGTTLQYIKEYLKALPHRAAREAVANIINTLDTGGIPGKDVPSVPIPGASVLPDDIPSRADTWVSRGVTEAKLGHRLIKRQMFPAQYQWNGEPKTFESYAAHLTGWAMQQLMGYFFDPTFVQAYRQGGWKKAKSLPVAVPITDAQFHYDNTLVYGALTSSVHSRARRYVLNETATQDGLKVYLQLRATYTGETNILHQASQLLKHLDQPFSNSFPGGMLGYIDHLLHILKQLDLVDPLFEHHVPFNERQKMSLILRRCSEVDHYARISYDFYTQMAERNEYDVEKYVTSITHYCHHIDPRGSNLAPVRAYNVDTETSTVQANYAGQPPHRSAPRDSGPSMPATGFRNFMYLTGPDYDHLKSTHADLLQRLLTVRAEVAAALVPLRGPLPPQLAKQATTLPTTGTAPTTPPITSGLPSQYPPRPTRGNFVHRDVTALNSQAVDDASLASDGEDPWDSIVYDGYGTDGTDSFDDRYINSVRTVRLPTLRLMLTRTSDYVSVVDGGADTMVLGHGWRFLEVFEHRKVNIVGFDESDARKYGCHIGTAVSVMTDTTGTDYLMVAHEAVENRRSRTSLLSEGQMRHFGLIVDSTSKRHRGIDGLPGTQSLYSPDKSIQFPMLQRDALMILPHRAPTDQEIETLPRFLLSDATPWSPTLLQDDDDGTTLLEHDFASGPTRVFHISNMPPSKAHSPRYVPDDDSTIESCDLTVHTDPPFFDLTRMDVQSASWHRFDHIPFVETVLSCSTSYPVLDPGDYTALVLYTARLPSHRPVKRVLDLFPVETPPTPSSPIAPLSPDKHPTTHAFFTSWDEGRIIGTPLPSKTNETIHVNGTSQYNDTSENDTYLTSLHFPAHMLEDCPMLQTCFMFTRAPTINAQRWRPYLAYRPIEVVRRTLEQTTQMAKLSSSIPMRRHVRSLFPFLNRKRINETVATDTFFSSVRDVSGATCAQVFYGITSHFINVYALKTEADGPQAFEDFARTEGLPNTIRSDNSKMQRYSAKLTARLREWMVKSEFTEPHHPQQNPAELRAIRWLKTNSNVIRMHSGAPSSTWFWIVKYLADVHNVTADESLSWATPWSKRRGETPDISAFLQFKFYEKVYYHDPEQKYPGTKEKPGYWLGVADQVGDRLCFHILTTDTHRIIERSVVRSAERSPVNVTLTFPKDDMHPTPVDMDADEDVISLAEEDIPDERGEHDDRGVSDELDLPTDDDHSAETDVRHNRTVPVPRTRPTGPPVYNLRSARRRQRFPHQRPRRGYTVQSVPMGPNTALMHTCPTKCPDLPDARPVSITDTPDYRKLVHTLTAKKQAQAKYVVGLDMFTDADDADAATWIPESVTRHKLVMKPRKRLMVRVTWKYHPPSWIDGNALQLQAPLLLVRYVRKNHLQEDPEFAWTKGIDIPEGQDTRRAHATATDGPKYKFGELVPQNTRHAMSIDRANGNTAWQDAIDTELKQINDYQTFRQPHPGEALTDFQRIPYHLVFDVKFDLRKKARLVAGGHKTAPPKEDLYSGVVDLFTVRLGHMIAAANQLKVCAADIGNAFLYGTTKEKVYIIAGPEFGALAGKPLIIDRGLYGLKSSSARFHEHLSAKLRSMGYRPTKADTDFWMKDCGEHYEYIATYVDDVLVYSKDPMKIIEELQRDYVLKGIGVPRYYLGGDILELEEAWQKQDNPICTALSAETYIGNAVDKYEQLFSTPDKPFTFRMYRSPMEQSYHPEEDQSALLNPRQSSVYRSLIGSANWIVTLGRFDIAYTVNTMSRFSMAPREGHFEALLRMFGYLKQYPKGRILVDRLPRYKTQPTFMQYDWNEFYPDATEELPPDMPPPKGIPMDTVCYVDADHAHDTVTRRSVSGILLFLNGMPVKWYSKRQKTVETSSYGSELVATRIAVELIIELRYKLRMLGVPVHGPTTMYGDNMAVVLNTTVPSSQLKKKHNAIAYHRVREAIAGNIVRLAHIPSEENIADILTKPLPIDAFQSLASQVLFREASPPPHPASSPPTECEPGVLPPGSRGGSMNPNSNINRSTRMVQVETTTVRSTGKTYTSGNNRDDLRPP
jgi:Reverse transcriptase (RNA-dependent DNA polymerase)